MSQEKTLITNRLKGKLVEKGVTLYELSDALGIHYNSLLRKLNVGEFTLSEIRKIVETLHLSDDELLYIFFTFQVA